MKLKCKFTYKCEVELTKAEVKIVKLKYAEKERIKEDLLNEINSFFLVGNGRNEVGVMTDFNLEVEE